MAISAFDRRSGPYAADGVTTAFTVDFFCQSPDHLRVETWDGSASTVYVLNTHYSVALNANQTINPGGTVTFFTAPASGLEVNIYSDAPYVQPTDLQQNQGYYVDAVEAMADNLNVQIQQVAVDVERSLRVPLRDGPIAQLPPIQPNHIVGFDASGNPTLIPSASLSQGPPGPAGTDGVCHATHMVFVRSATPPLPLSGGSYDFVTNTFTPPSGTFVTIPAGTDDVWMAIGYSYSPTATTVTPTWGAWNNLTLAAATTPPILWAPLSVFMRSATPPTGAPSGGSFNFQLATLNPPAGASASPPTGTDPLYISTGYATTTSAAAWVTPVWSNWQQLAPGLGPAGANVGEVRLLHWNMSKTGWLRCDGSVYLKSAYPALSALLDPLSIHPFSDFAAPTHALSWRYPFRGPIVKFSGQYVAVRHVGPSSDSTISRFFTIGGAPIDLTTTPSWHIGGATWLSVAGPSSNRSLVALHYFTSQPSGYLTIWNSNFTYQGLFASWSMPENQLLEIEPFGDHLYILDRTSSNLRIRAMSFPSLSMTTVYSGPTLSNNTTCIAVLRETSRLTFVVNDSSAFVVLTFDGSTWTTGTVSHPLLTWAFTSLRTARRMRWNPISSRYETMLACNFLSGRRLGLIHSVNGVDFIIDVYGSAPLDHWTPLGWVEENFLLFRGDFWGSTASEILADQSGGLRSFMVRHQSGVEYEFGVQITAFGGSAPSPILSWVDTNEAYLSVIRALGSNPVNHIYQLLPAPFSPATQFRVPTSATSVVSGYEWWIKT